MSKIEEVARAICDGHTHGNADWDEIPEQYRNSYRAAAQAAIESMRTPNAAMARSVAAQWGRRTWSQYSDVIDAALEQAL